MTVYPQAWMEPTVFEITQLHPDGIVLPNWLCDYLFGHWTLLASKLHQKMIFIKWLLFLINSRCIRRWKIASFPSTAVLLAPNRPSFLEAKVAWPLKQYQHQKSPPSLYCQLKFALKEQRLPLSEFPSNSLCNLFWTFFVALQLITFLPLSFSLETQHF